MMNEHEEEEKKVDIPGEIEALARHMEFVAGRMIYYAGFNSEVIDHGRELSGAAAIAQGWAVGMREEAEDDKRETSENDE